MMIIAIALSAPSASIITSLQTLVWVGMFYAPLLPIIACVVTVIVFYVVQWSMRKFLSRPANIFRAANTTFD